MRMLERWFPAVSRKRTRHVDDLVLYYFTTCPYCRRVRRVMANLGITMRTRHVHRDSAAQAELVAGGGRPMVPCLRIRTGANDKWMYESRVIVHYLQQRFGTGPS